MATAVKTSSTPQLARVTRRLLAARRRAGNRLLDRYERGVALIMARENALASRADVSRVVAFVDVQTDLVLQMARAQTSMARKLHGLGPGPPPQVIGGRRVDAAG
jgi:hypothetical protein